MFGLPGTFPATYAKQTTDGMGAPLGRIGALEVRLARSAAEVRAAQALRYRVFYGEMQATADPRTFLRRRDADAFDRYCDHLLVLDHDDVEIRPFRKARPRIVGTYRPVAPEGGRASSRASTRRGNFPLSRCWPATPAWSSWSSAAPAS